MKIIVAGVTGLVGQEILEVLTELSPQVTSIVPVASERSAGKKISFRGDPYKVVSFPEAKHSGAEYAIFSAGAAVSRQWAYDYAAHGITVVDNSSAWRNDAEVPLVVPEVNADTISRNDKIIANPNCSTIQMVAALSPLHRYYRIKRIVVATYQSVSGSGAAGIEQLEAERAHREPARKAYPHPIDLNVLPHGGDFLEQGYTTEEVKLVDETRKILEAPKMAITATVVRVPVTGGHAEAVNVEFEKSFRLKDIRQLLEDRSGIIVEDRPSENIYPMPLHIRKSNFTHVGRIRRDFSTEHGLNLWIVADNLRKGAATNAVQILNTLTRGRENDHPSEGRK
ncbi:MAG: aspartate-semialdehyde dehydrogenase [Bacteroidales bacterium]